VTEETKNETKRDVSVSLSESSPSHQRRHRLTQQPSTSTQSKDPTSKLQEAEADETRTRTRAKTDHHALPDIQRRLCRILVGHTESEHSHPVHVVCYRFGFGDLRDERKKKMSQYSMEAKGRKRSPGREGGELGEGGRQGRRSSVRLRCF